MSYQGKYWEINDFSGGEVSYNTVQGDLGKSMVLPMNTANSLDNIILLPDGRGFRGRYETVYNNSTEFGAADNYPVVGVGHLGLANGSTYLLAVKKNKVYGTTTASTRAATYTDRTGAITIGTGGSSATDRAGYRWTFCTFNDQLIAFGGLITSPSAPFKWTGETNDITALAGSPPSAAFCFAANNRVFAGRTAVAPSTLFWSILGSSADWTGTGSGSTVIGSVSDGEPILDFAVLSNNLVLIFKLNSIWAVDLTSAPFPTRLLFNGVGCGGPAGYVTVIDGLAYFMTASYQMKATDGNKVIDFPSPPSMAGVGGITPSSATTLPLVYGFRLRNNSFYNPHNYDLLVWTYNNASGGTDLDGERVAVAWDFMNKCWIRFSTGFAFLCGTYSRDGTFFGGWTNQGRVFTPDQPAFNGSTLFKDDLTTGSGIVTSYWQSGWLKEASLESMFKPNRFTPQVKTLMGASYSATLTWGFNFGSLSRSATISLASGTSGIFPRVFLTGTGSIFKYKFAFSQTTANDLITVDSFTISGKTSNQHMKAAA